MKAAAKRSRNLASPGIGDKLGLGQCFNGPHEFILTPMRPRSSVDKVAKRVHEASCFGYRTRI